jgi:hypothetical protein
MTVCSFSCRRHDNQVKEKADGTRKSNGVFKVIGCDVNGWPIAHAHNLPRVELPDENHQQYFKG